MDLLANLSYTFSDIYSLVLAKSYPNFSNSLEPYYIVGLSVTWGFLWSTGFLTCYNLSTIFFKWLGVAELNLVGVWARCLSEYVLIFIVLDDVLRIIVELGLLLGVVVALFWYTLTD